MVRRPLSLIRPAMPKTEHYQWYVEQFSDTESHHHAIDELYYSGKTPFQWSRRVADGDVREDARARRRHAEFASRREDLSRVVSASALARVPGAARSADPWRRRGCGRSAKCCGTRAWRAARWSTSTVKSSSSPEVSARVVGRRVRRSARERDHRRRAAFIKEPGTFDAIISDLTEPLPTHRRFRSSRRGVPTIKSALAPGGVYVLQASTAGFHNMALHAKMAFAARALRARRELFHPRAGLR